jgi:hypothetical protein
MAGADDKLEIVPDGAIEVRETRTLFRLAPIAANDLSRSSRQVAIVAADTEDEARQIASMHDAFGRDWRDPHFAVCDVLETSETHVFGDVIVRSEPVAPEGRTRVAKRRWEGTRAVRIRFPPMTVSLTQLLEGSFQIAWEYLERTGELGDGAVASRFLSDTIETMIRQGQRSRLASPIVPSAHISVFNYPAQRNPDRRRAHPPDDPQRS